MPKRNLLSPTSELLDSWGRAGNRKLFNRSCLHCGNSFRPSRTTTKYCSRKCSWANNGKSQRTVDECWWVDNRGYLQGFIRRDGKKVRVKQHRHLMEIYIGRPLLPTEDIHHINGDKRDNRLANLQVLNHGEHSALTNRQRSRKAEEGA
jgi:hypothetical protein